MNFDLHYVVDELFEISIVLLLGLLFQVDLRLPEVYAQWLLSESEGVCRLVKVLDASLSGLDVLVQDVSEFVVGEGLSIDDLGVVLHLDRGNWSSLAELGLELLLSDLLGDESHEDVRFEGLLLVSNNWVRGGWGQVVLLSLNVLRDKNSLILHLGLHVGCIQGCLSVLVGLVADEACSVVFGVY